MSEGEQAPACSIDRWGAHSPNLSGRWKIEKCGGKVGGFAKAMGASFAVRQTFLAAVALLNRAAIKRIYTVRQQGDSFVIVVNEGDRMAQHTERFVAGAAAVQSAGVGDAWRDSLANADVYVAAARWEGDTLRTDVAYAATSASAYEGEWRAEGEKLRYTLVSIGGGTSMWVLLVPATAGVESPRPEVDTHRQVSSSSDFSIDGDDDIDDGGPRFSSFASTAGPHDWYEP